MPMDLILHFPAEHRTVTVPDAISFEVEFGDKNRVIIDQTDGRSCEYEARGLTVSGGTETDERHFE